MEQDARNRDREELFRRRRDELNRQEHQRQSLPEDFNAETYISLHSSLQKKLEGHKPKKRQKLATTHYISKGQKKLSLHA